MTRPTTAARRAPDHHRSAPQILVVDDEVPIAALIADVLEEEGYQVAVRHDGASALLDILATPPDLLILDIAMPVMVGDELLRYLRHHGYQDLPVLVMTASLHPEQYLAQGATAVLAKPFDLLQLLSLVARHIRPRELENER